MFPLMKTMHNSEATAATECQDLMGMSFRTFHFDGVVRVPSYLEWLMHCDMRETYAFHRRVLKLLQWHCPPTLWHLKTPVHMFALDALVETYPNAKFLWSHRDPAKVMGSVCSLIRYVRSWSSDRNDPEELGAEQLNSWAEAVRRAMDFRHRVGDSRFADVAFADLQDDPVDTLRAGYASLGLTFSEDTERAVEQWAHEHKPGSRGAHDYELSDYGLTPEGVREQFADYLRTYDATG
jgi:Sulfotransferase family